MIPGICFGSFIASFLLFLDFGLLVNYMVSASDSSFHPGHYFLLPPSSPSAILGNVTEPTLDTPL